MTDNITLYTKSGTRYSEATLPEVGSTFVRMLLEKGRTRLSFRILHLMVEELGQPKDSIQTQTQIPASEQLP